MLLKALFLVVLLVLTCEQLFRVLVEDVGRWVQASFHDRAQGAPSRLVFTIQNLLQMILLVLLQRQGFFLSKSGLWSRGCLCEWFSASRDLPRDCLVVLPLSFWNRLVRLVQRALVLLLKLWSALLEWRTTFSMSCISLLSVYLLALVCLASQLELPYVKLVDLFVVDVSRLGPFV